MFLCRPGLRPVRITVLDSNFNGATARPYFSVAYQLERYAAIFPDKGRGYPTGQFDYSAMCS
jgi:hypothetical protein